MNYNIIDSAKPKTVTVITPTTGSVKLDDAIESVKNQTYKNLQHLIVIDGPEALDNLHNNVPLRPTPHRLSSYVLHENTGGNGLNGQRIYAAFPHLINSDYIFFLDQDNWYEPNHVESLVALMEQNNLDWAYSLRQIYTADKRYVAHDNCESLGKWPIYFSHDNPQYLIDTSAFAFRKDFIQRTCHLWHSGPWGEDRRYLHAVKNVSKWDTTREHTLCYRLDGNPNSVTRDFFIKGNEVMRMKYNNEFPWSKK
jgi:glycosyltransferase involved in cell wall biosynthesis